jgi:PAS domain-containing protein
MVEAHRLKNVENSVPTDHGQSAKPQEPSASGSLLPPDFKAVFDVMPGMCLILDTAFNIVAQNAEHAKATLSTAKNIVGRPLFEVFPDNPNDSGADGVSAVRRSLLNVLKTRQTDVMPIVRYDVQPEIGRYQTRYWEITNTPMLGEDGYVRWIINRAQDVTALVELGQKRPG